MAKPFLIMHRTGMFTPGQITDNQCSKCGQEEYHYRLIMAFDNTVVLDEMQFIFDSTELTDRVCKLSPTGSCEQMHYELAECIKGYFEEKKIPVLVYKFSIVSEESAKQNRAWFEHVSFPLPEFMAKEAQGDESGLHAFNAYKAALLSPHCI